MKGAGLRTVMEAQLRTDKARARRASALGKTAQRTRGRALQESREQIADYLRRVPIRNY